MDLTYTLKRSRRKTVAIIVHRDQSVEVRAPVQASTRELEAFIRKKRQWIKKKQQEFMALPPREVPQYRFGAEHYFLGKKYRLCCANGAAVQSPERCIWLPLAVNSSEEKIQRALLNWYRQQADQLFQERMNVWIDQMEPDRLPDIELKIRRMKSRWGSCRLKGAHKNNPRGQGVVTLNLDLIRYPLDCIDCVIVHELCHFREMNHSRRFYQQMTALFPEWKQYDSLLNQLSRQY